jgi:hypothetical protein
MSPRGFYSKEVITPYFTSERYINSDQGKEDLDRYLSMESRLRSIIKYPQRLWLNLLIAVGILAVPSQDENK